MGTSTVREALRRSEPAGKKIVAGLQTKLESFRQIARAVFDLSLKQLFMRTRLFQPALFDLVLRALITLSWFPPGFSARQNWRRWTWPSMKPSRATSVPVACCHGVEHSLARPMHKAFGNRALVPAREAMTEDTIFDAASLTKVTATTPAVMLLVQRGQGEKLEAPVTAFVPEFTGDGREFVTVRELLTHTSGLPPDLETKTDWHGQVEAVRKACTEKLQSQPGTAFKYSDINFILLGEIVQRVSQTPLEIFVQREIFAPLKMTDTGFRPPAEKLPRIAPTEVVDGRPWHGVVHDPTARHMGGVAGHAGLFTTAADLARYARMLLNLGELDGMRIFQPAAVKLMTSVQTPPQISARRGLGWDIDSPYKRTARRNISRSAPMVTPAGRAARSGSDPFSKTFS